VYLVSVSNYDFPSALPGDQFISEKWFVRNRLNLIAEMISKLKALEANDPEAYALPEGSASQDARVQYASERLRLFYVGIARKELIITWNTGREGRNQIAVPFSALIGFQEQHHEPS
jgi:DNA helicase-2/ATP-dependent DNA helicase PcrA